MDENAGHPRTLPYRLLVVGLVSCYSGAARCLPTSTCPLQTVASPCSTGVPRLPIASSAVLFRSS